MKLSFKEIETLRVDYDRSVRRSARFLKKDNRELAEVYNNFARELLPFLAILEAHNV